MTLSDALEAQQQALRYGGGRSGVLNLSAVEGAIGRPYHGYHRSMTRKAAALLHGVSTSHGFLDANKRAAWLLVFTLVERSGYRLDLGENDRIDDVSVAVVTGTMTEAELCDWFRGRLRKT